MNEFVTVRVPTTLLNHLKALSDKEQKTTSAIIREAIVDRINAKQFAKGQQ